MVVSYEIHAYPHLIGEHESIPLEVRVGPLYTPSQSVIGSGPPWGHSGEGTSRRYLLARKLQTHKGYLAPEPAEVWIGHRAPAACQGDPWGTSCVCYPDINEMPPIWIAVF